MAPIVQVDSPPPQTGAPKETQESLLCRSVVCCKKSFSREEVGQPGQGGLFVPQHISVVLRAQRRWIETNSYLKQNKELLEVNLETKMLKLSRSV